MTRIEETSVKRANLQQQLKDARLTLEATEKSSAAAEKDLEQCHRQIAEEKARQVRKAALKTEHEGMLIRAAEGSAGLESANQKVRSCQETLQSRERIRADVENLEKLRKEEAVLRRMQTELQTLTLDRTRLEAELATARLKVEARQQHWLTVVTELKRQITDGEAALAGSPKARQALQELTDLRKKDQELIALKNQKEEIAKQKHDLDLAFNSRRSDFQIKIETRQSKRRELQSLLDRRTELELAFRDADQHLDKFQALNEEMENVKRAGIDAQQTEERLKERIEDLGQRRQQVGSQTGQLTAHDTPDCPLCGSELDENHRSDVLDRLGRETGELDREHKAVSRNLSETKCRREAFRGAYQKLRNQVHTLGDAPRNFAQAEAELTQASKVEEDMTRLVGDIQDLENQARDFEASSDMAIELRQLRERTEQLGVETLRHDAVRAQIETLAPAELESARLDEIQIQTDATRAQAPEADLKFTAATEWLEAERYAPEAQEHLAELNKKAEALGYDETEHETMLSQIEQLAISEKEFSALQDAERDLAVARTKRDAADARLREMGAGIRKTEEELVSFQDVDEKRELFAEEKDRLSALLIKHRTSRDIALRQVASLERDEEICLQLEARREDTATELAHYEKDATLYRELVKAFGRDGIQALMIDQAIPELQDEANRILSRLTANGTQVTLESLGELKGGGAKETLDIRISDELGERRYELYSGGEAFRVDFAIRIALSKLLARRSGTPLQTLVIDEGFGTQDEEGLTHLIDAIQTISDEFEKVLVITHIDAIKNAFPVQIEVVKHADSGSTFRVVS